MEIIMPIILLIILIVSSLIFISCISNNNELNFKESILISLFFISLVTLLCNENELPIFFYINSIYYILIIIYYIKRSTTLKKFIPMKIIIGNILLIALNAIIIKMLLSLHGVQIVDLKFSEITYLHFFEPLYQFMSTTYLIILLLINFIIFIENIMFKELKNYFNKNYKINKIICIVNLIITLITFICILVLMCSN